MALLVLKLLSVAASYASGNAGGIFGPSLFLGAMLGGLVGTIGHALSPSHVGTSGAYALVGMGTAFAGIVRAPMISMMIFEITRDCAVIVPLMISNLVSFFVASRFQKEPIYDLLAHQDGIHLPSADSRALQGNLRVLQAMRAAEETLDAETTLRDAEAKTQASALAAWPVCSPRGDRSPGTRGDPGRGEQRRRRKKTVRNDGSGQGFSARARGSFSAYGVDRMGSAGLDPLPVVSRVNVNQLLGMVTLDDVLAVYRVRGKATVKSERNDAPK